MLVLGISCFYHDAAAALISDGMLVAAAEEERFSRVKHDARFPTHAIEYCLAQGRIVSQELDYVIFYEKPLVKLERILTSTLSGFPSSWNVFHKAMTSWLHEKLWVKSLLQKELDVPANRILFTEHHLSHAASAFFCSPFEEAAILTVDGVGEWATTSIGSARSPFGDSQARLTVDYEIRFPHSLGMLYSAFTAFLGFEVNEGEYKVMGMAPYGQARFAEQVRKVIDLRDDGGFRLNMEYFAFDRSSTHTFTQRFTEVFGRSRIADTEFVTQQTHPGVTGREAEMEENQRYADIAASIQLVTEETLLALAHAAYERTGLNKLCMAGGVGLNCTANGRILREGPFDEVFIQPAAGDSGGALGAALYAHHILLGGRRRFVMEHAYWGPAYEQDALLRALEADGASFEVFDDQERLIEQTVESLLTGGVVGWFEGRSEWGPRALGHRSILADPRRPGMKEVVNRKIKFREPFRPFAPSVPVENAAKFFDIAEPEQQYPARFMLLTSPVIADQGDLIPAVNHLGTARLQAVHQMQSPRFHHLLSCFGQATSIPILLNTSFNLRGEPIVNTPAEALRTFHAGGMELLVLNDILVRQKD